MAATESTRRSPRTPRTPRNPRNPRRSNRYATAHRNAISRRQFSPGTTEHRDWLVRYGRRVIMARNRVLEQSAGPTPVVNVLGLESTGSNPGDPMILSDSSDDEIDFSTPTPSVSTGLTSASTTPPVFLLNTTEESQITSPILATAAYLSPSAAETSVDAAGSSACNLSVPAQEPGMIVSATGMPATPTQSPLDSAINPPHNLVSTLSAPIAIMASQPAPAEESLVTVLTTGMPTTPAQGPVNSTVSSPHTVVSNPPAPIAIMTSPPGAGASLGNAFTLSTTTTSTSTLSSNAAAGTTSTAMVAAPLAQVGGGDPANYRFWGNVPGVSQCKYANHLFSDVLHRFGDQGWLWAIGGNKVVLRAHPGLREAFGYWMPERPLPPVDGGFPGRRRW